MKSVTVSAKDAAVRLLDAFYLEGRVLTEDEYASLRDALWRPDVPFLGRLDSNARSAAATKFGRLCDANIVRAA